MYKYIEVIEYNTDTVVKRMNVTHKTERQVDRIINGIMINLNTDKYCVDCVEYRESKELI